MIDPDKYIRQAFGNCLSGNVMYKGQPVEVVDSFTEEILGNVQIMITNQDGNDSSNKHAFNSNRRITIDIVTKTTGSGNKAIADGLAEQVTQLIQPSRATKGVAIDGRWQIVGLRQLSSGYIMEGERTGFIVRKILTYGFTIIQN